MDIFIFLPISIILLIFILLYKIILIFDKRTEYEFNLSSFDGMSAEIYNFSMSILTKSILDNLLVSKVDMDGNRLIIQDLTDSSKPLYQGIVSLIVGSMSKSLKYKFYHYYKTSKSNMLLISHISDILDLYIRNIVTTLAVFDSEADSLNKTAIINNKSRIDVGNYSYNKLLISIENDVRRFITFKDVE